MLTSYIIDVERNYNNSLNLIISLGTVPCLHFVTIMVYIRKVIIAKIQCQTVVGQEMVAINDLKIPIYMHCLIEL